MTNEQIQELLFKYVEVILKCEGIINKYYGLSGIPYLNKDKIPKSNKLKLDEVQLEYNFHGIGCTFILGPIELDYSIYVDRENYIVVSPWGFTNFVNTFLRLEVDYTEAQISEWLEILNDKRIIKKIFPEYLVYEISFKWFYAFNNDNVSN